MYPVKKQFKLTHYKGFRRVVIIVLILALLLGFVNWETLFAVEFKSEFIRSLTSERVGLVGLIGLLIMIFIRIRNGNSKFQFTGIVICSFGIVLLSVIWCVSLLFDDFIWRDVAVYKNRNEYVVVEEFDGFVTTSVGAPRLIYTHHPYAAIREVRSESLDEANVFHGTEVKYQGKLWKRQ